ncbi:MAG: hypothetical protein NTW87_29520 [Planctomycetota bacterium]|nr:hypothetical protein [Planctomycetota bacterium]
MKTASQANVPPGAAVQRAAAFNWFLLAFAWLAAWAVYSPALRAPWFYDDADYVLNDPRLGRLELFLPSHWSDPPPALENRRGETPYLPGYGKPLIADRYLWRLSFALERRAFGESHSPAVAHAVNLFLHLACIAALFFALSRLLALYGNQGRPPRAMWSLLPGVSACVFAVHPWAAEPVCYVSARNASMGALFVLIGTGLWAGMLQTPRSWAKRVPEAVGALLCVLAAVSCKESFITAPAGYLLVTWPVLWSRVARWKRAAALGLAAGAVIALCAVAWLGIHGSERASGLWAQVGARGWEYFLDIQNPLVLKTLGDQLPARRLALEANHPNWPLWACGVALAANAVLVLLGTLGGKRWPLLLGLGWFYLHLAPANSFLPRPDFLAARNVYLPAAGTATLFAAAMIGLVVWLRSRLVKAAGPKGLPAGRGWTVGVVPLALWLYWATTAQSWASAFVDPVRVWERSAAVAPDHAAVRFNLAWAILKSGSPTAAKAEERAEQEALAALAAEDSATMKFHTERPRAIRRAVAFRLVGLIHYQRRDMAEAERNFRRSWALLPSASTWVGWAGSCVEGNLQAQLADALAEGLREWPDQWWPQAMRGVRAVRRSQAGPLSASARRDLEAAERAPDETVPELRSLQGMALYYLAEADPKPERFLERLQGLGMPPAMLARLRTRPSR